MANLQDIKRRISTVKNPGSDLVPCGKGIHTHGNVLAVNRQHRPNRSGRLAVVPTISRRDLNGITGIKAAVAVPIDILRSGRASPLPAERVVVNVGERGSRISVEIINDTIDGVPILVIGSSDSKFGVVFERTLADGTLLTFSGPTEPLPSVATDNEGNSWDLFGKALTGPRAGERLPLTDSHIAYWFAWGAFHPSSEIYNL